MTSQIPTRDAALALLKKKTEEILKENDWPEDLIRAVVSHGWGICTDVKPESTMEKVLFAIDELTGLVATSVGVGEAFKERHGRQLPLG